MNDGSERRGSFRRPEALPLGWAMLSAQQRSAVQSLSSWMLDALTSLDSHTPKARSARVSNRAQAAAASSLDADRRSQIAFIDGDRGTGKTSVLLTLRMLTEESVFQATLPPPVEMLRNQRERIQWLETLDMEPLSRGTNLFAAILARVAAVVDHRLAPMPAMAMALSDASGSFEEVSANLQQLQNDAAIVWDRMDAGAPDGDPQVRALWVNQAERAALDMHGRISTVMDGVARLLAPRSQQEMLFVVPVDDFDLAPAHCLELLRLIRMITTPRLVFVVAGNIRVAETVLRLKSEGDLLALAGTASAQLRDLRDLFERAAEVAANNMRKLVPPGQRFALRRLTLNEALNLGVQTSGQLTLRKALSQVTIEVNQAHTGRAQLSLADFLLLNQKTEAPISEAEWLAGTPRQVLDQIALLEDLAAGQKPPATSSGDASPPLTSDQRIEADDRIVIRLMEDLRRQIREEWRLPIRERERLVERLDTTNAVRVDFSPLEVLQEPGLAQSVSKSGPVHVERRTVARVRVLLKQSPSAAERQKLESPLGPEAPEVPYRLAVGLLLMHDIVGSLWGGYLRHSPLTYASQGQIGAQVQTVWRTDGDSVALPWPMPEWWTFRDVERFSRSFEALAASAGSDLGIAWLAAIFATYRNESPETTGFSRGYEHLDRGLGEVLAENPNRIARRVLRGSVLVSVVLMLAPEMRSGVSLSMFQKHGRALLDAVQGADLVSTVRERRARLVREIDALEASDAAAIEALMAVRPLYGLERICDRLVLELDGSKTPAAEWVRELRQRLHEGRATEAEISKTLLASGKGHIAGSAATKPLLAIARRDYVRLRGDPVNEYGKGIFIPNEEDRRAARTTAPRSRR